MDDAASKSNTDFQTIKAVKQTSAEKLKQQTSSLHHKLDQHPLVRKFLAKDIDEISYQKLLNGFYRAYSYLEPALNSFESEDSSIPQYASRLTTLSNAISTRPITHPSDSLSQHTLSAPAYWGRRYVLDGSCHGAQFMLPRLVTKLGAEHASLTYWRLLAQQATHWPALVNQLNNFNNSHDDFHIMVSEACMTFEYFITSLNSEMLSNG